MVIAEVRPVGKDHLLLGDGHVQIGEPSPDHAVKAGRGDAQDGEGRAVDEQCFAGDRRFAQVRAPVVEIEDGDGIGAGSGFVGGNEEAAHGGADAQGLKIIAGDQFGGNAFGAMVPGDAGIMLRGRDEAAEDVSSCRAGRGSSGK